MQPRLWYMEVTATATGIDVVDPEELKRRTELSASGRFL